jgi:hypothetical protein
VAKAAKSVHTISGENGINLVNSQSDLVNVFETLKVTFPYKSMWKVR